MPRYNTANKQGAIDAQKQLDFYKSKGLIIDIDLVNNTRSNLQNRALHLYYKHVATALLEVGVNYHYVDEMTGEIMEIPYTGDLVKNFIWRPLQEKMFEIESTTKLTTQMINDILDVLSLWLSEKNKSVTFPNKMDLLIKQLNQSNTN